MRASRHTMSHTLYLQYAKKFPSIHGTFNILKDNERVSGAKKVFRRVIRYCEVVWFYTPAICIDTYTYG